MKNLLASLILLIPLSAVAGPDREILDSHIDADTGKVIELRRWFHQNPELSNREFNTSKRVAEELQALGLEVETGIAHTGVVGLLRGGKPGPTVAVRADMDALPVKEQTGLPFASTAMGEYAGEPVSVMHACGHDAHMAMVLGAARALSQVKDQLAGDVLFIFQPAEEKAPAGEEGGAELMLKEGLFERYPVEAIFGMHVGVGQPGGGLAVRSGMHMAAVDSFEITVKGRQTHGARPWGGVDPVVTAAQIVGALQTIVSRKLNITTAPAIVTVGKISGGVRHNIIPDEVELWGTIRTFDEAMRLDIHERVERIATDIAHSQDAEVDVEIFKGYPATFNDPGLYEKMLPTLEMVSGDKGVAVPPILTVAEDFAFFANAVPGFYFQMGVVADGVDAATVPSNHSPLFDVEEKHLQKGTRALSHLVVDYLDN